MRLGPAAVRCVQLELARLRGDRAFASRVRRQFKNEAPARRERLERERFEETALRELVWVDLVHWDWQLPLHFVLDDSADGARVEPLAVPNVRLHLEEDRPEHLIILVAPRSLPISSSHSGSTCSSPVRARADSGRLRRRERFVAVERTAMPRPESSTPHCLRRGRKPSV